MSNLEQFLDVEGEWILERMSDLGISSGESYTYYQGRLDQLAQVRRYLDHAQLIREGK